MKAVLATAIAGLISLVPVINVFVLIAVMLPLWVLDGMGVPGLGRELNGFFIPSAIGWGLVAIVVWVLFFVVFLGAARRRVMSSHDRPPHQE